MADRAEICASIASSGGYLYCEELMIREHPSDGVELYMILVFIIRPQATYLGKNGVDLHDVAFYMTLDEAITACEIYSGQETEWNDHD